MNVTIYVKKGQEYVWRVVRSYATTHNVHVSDLVVKALTEYMIKHP